MLLNVITARFDEVIINNTIGKIKNLHYKNGKVLLTFKKKKPCMILQEDNEDIYKDNHRFAINSIGIFNIAGHKFNILLDQAEKIKKLCFLSDKEFIVVMHDGEVNKL